MGVALCAKLRIHAIALSGTPSNQHNPLIGDVRAFFRTPR
jgi:hypothetical protein